MGLDITIIQTTKNLDLTKLYSIYDVVQDNFDWYLGNDRGTNSETWNSLYEKLNSLTRDDVLDASTDDPEEYEFLKSIQEKEFNEYLELVKKSVGKHVSGNSHLHLEWENLPGEHIESSCSSNLWELLKSCAKTSPSATWKDDILIELDVKSVLKLAKCWKKKSFAFQLIKIIGYFNPEAAYRMVEDYDERFNLDWCDINDLIYYKDALSSIKSKLDFNCKLWVVASY